MIDGERYNDIHIDGSWYTPIDLGLEDGGEFTFTQELTFYWKIIFQIRSIVSSSRTEELRTNWKLLLYSFFIRCFFLHSTTKWFNKMY